MGLDYWKCSMPHNLIVYNCLGTHNGSKSAKSAQKSKNKVLKTGTKTVGAGRSKPEISCTVVRSGESVIHDCIQPV